MNDFVVQMVLSFSISIGMILGGALLGSLGSLLIGGYPATTMIDVAERIRIWAAVGAIGGTWRLFELALWERQFPDLIQQVFIVIATFTGAHLGYTLIQWVVKT